jgi:hypothetical protein
VTIGIPLSSIVCVITLYLCFIMDPMSSSVLRCGAFYFCSLCDISVAGH